MRATLAIYKKDLRETVRDWKTLVLMIVLPTCFFPATILGFIRFIELQSRENATYRVRVVADRTTWDMYCGLVHKWFIGTDLSRDLDNALIAVGPLMSLDSSGMRKDSIPENLRTDRDVFVGWLRSLALQARQDLSRAELQQAVASFDKLSNPARNEILDFWALVAIQGLGLVEWVDLNTAYHGKQTSTPEVGGSADFSVPPEVRRGLDTGKIDAFMASSIDLSLLLANESSCADISVAYNGSRARSHDALVRIREVIEKAGPAITRMRLERYASGKAISDPVVLRNEINTITTSEGIFRIVCQMVPFIILLFTLLGALFSVSVGVGEKEHNTLEAIVVSPIPREALPAENTCSFLLYRT